MSNKLLTIVYGQQPFLERRTYIGLNQAFGPGYLLLRLKDWMGSLSTGDPNKRHLFGME